VDATIACPSGRAHWANASYHPDIHISASATRATESKGSRLLFLIWIFYWEAEPTNSGLVWANYDVVWLFNRPFWPTFFPTFFKQLFPSFLAFVSHLQEMFWALSH
jgi:hypothetical protein